MALDRRRASARIGRPSFSNSPLIRKYRERPSRGRSPISVNRVERLGGSCDVQGGGLTNYMNPTPTPRTDARSIER